MNFKLIFRRFKENLSFSILNIASLTIGLACVFIVLLFVLTELSYDSYFKYKDRTYRLTSFDSTFNKREVKAPFPMIECLRNDFPQVEEAIGFLSFDNFKLKKEDSFFDEENLKSSDNAIFDFFSIDVLKGNVKTPLPGYNSIAISEKIAKKYFSAKNPTGLPLSLFIEDTVVDFTVSAIFKDIPASSSFQANFIITNDMGMTLKSKSMILLGNNENTEKISTSWELNYFHIFFRLLRNEKIENVFIPHKNIFQSYLSNDKQYSYQKITDIHLHSDDIVNDEMNHGSLKQVKIFALIASLILLLICLNYIILSLAKSTRKIKETGVRIMPLYQPVMVLG